ncbi:hypothetical protein [Aliikangiella coralliicola]|uniref:hypothetical protein n=1 Tax=Aliikangiella coralliicola TaxID=2592383 RepID=UPI001AEF9A4D|nr:hypothetical protein [Aliikangiella coralliicola]
MMKLLGVVVLSCLMVSFNSFADPAENGQVHKTDSGELRAWDNNQQKWLSLDAFWESYASSQGGLTWGKRVDYPPYEKVKEHDTMIIQLDQGPCLMEFFHSRWRRANDVRRWDDAFNEYAGCPYVFD